MNLRVGNWEILLIYVRLETGRTIWEFWEINFFFNIIIHLILFSESSNSITASSSVASVQAEIC